jgi:voltage-gated potassium channel
VLFVLTLGLHIALPLVRGVDWLYVLVGLAFVTVLGYAGWITIERPRFRRVYAGLMIVSIVTTWLQMLGLGGWMRSMWLGYHAVSMCISVVAVVAWTIRCERVTLDTVFAALSGYYLMGFTWGLIYLVVDSLVADAFSVALVVEGGISRAFYFSFVTLTTLGFGDVTPTHPLTQALVTTEALIGQIYLVVLVARLVAIRSDAEPA